MEKLHLRFDISAIHVYAVRHLPNSVERAGGATEWNITTNGDDTEYSLRRQSKPRANNESDTHRTSTGVRGQGPGRGPGCRDPGAGARGPRGTEAQACAQAARYVTARQESSNTCQRWTCTEQWTLVLKIIPLVKLLIMKIAISTTRSDDRKLLLHKKLW